MVNEELLASLVLKLKEGKNGYFDELYELTKKQVFYMCYSIVKNTSDAEDLLQDTYLKFLNNIHKVKENNQILGYLLTIAKNTSLNFIKRRNKETIIEWDNIAENDTKPTNYENLELVDKMKKILKPLEFQIVILHVINELKHNEIAKLLKKPLGTITYTYKCAIDKLRREINEYWK